MMTIAKRDVAARWFDETGLGSLLLRAKTWNGILILNYHRVGDASTSPFDPELFSATPEEFDEQVRFLKATCNVIGPREIEAVRKKRQGRFVLLTFDDGYVDNFTIALPILRAHGVTAAFFLATGFLDRPRVPWWDEITWISRVDAPITIPGGTWLQEPVHLVPITPQPALLLLHQVYHRIPSASRDAYLDFLGETTGRGRCEVDEGRALWMTWDMVRGLNAAGMVLGGHTHEHVLLSEESRERQRNEIETCLRRIEDEAGERPDVFSYPFGSPGSFNGTTQICLAQANVRHAFTFFGGCGRFDEDPLSMPRIAVERFLSLQRFRMIVACPNWFKL